MGKYKNKVSDYTSEIREQFNKYGNVQNLMRYFNEENLKNEHNRLRKTKVDGIDNVTKEIYNNNLNKNLSNLVQSLKSKTYKPKPVKRIYIPKPNNKYRPLGIPVYQDKIVQSVMANILNAIYEPMFLDCSFGFRPNLNCHLALIELSHIMADYNINYIVEVDIKGFFDNVNHQKLINFLKYTIKDKDFIYYINKFLKCGVMLDGKRLKTKKGTPQGGIISPILANVYLHYVLDIWFETYIKTKFKICELIRYADDFIVLFENKADAKQFKKELKKRLAKYDLYLEPSKTHIIQFGKNSINNNTFDFLGFTISGSTDIFGKFKVNFITSPTKYETKKTTIKKVIAGINCRNYTYSTTKLNFKLKGFYNYYNVDTNIACIENIYNYTEELLIQHLKKHKIKASALNRDDNLSLSKPNYKKTKSLK